MFNNTIYGLTKKPHYKLKGKLPMNMIFYDEKGYLYRYLPEDKLYYCYASALIKNRK